MRECYCKDIIEILEDIAPTRLAEQWDNVGLIIGDRNSIVKNVMICVDAVNSIIEECIEKSIDLIISHHPFIYKDIKRITTDDPKGKAIHKLLKNNISVYSSHTNFDVANGGLNDFLAETLQLGSVMPLETSRYDNLYKMVVFVPEDSTAQVRNAISKAGAGRIGNYSDCFFECKGIGMFRPLSGANPYVGTEGEIERVPETRIETIVHQSILGEVIDEMIKVHPYEEVAYDVIPLKRYANECGFGRVGILEQEMDINEFVHFTKRRLNLDYVRIVGSPKRQIKTVAVFCGGFDASLVNLDKLDVDVIVTGDIKYHIALDMIERGICCVDAGHFGTERIVVDKITSILAEKFPYIKFHKSDIENDPLKIRSV